VTACKQTPVVFHAAKKRMGKGLRKRRKRIGQRDTDKKEVCKKRKVIDDKPQWIEDPRSTTDDSASCNYMLVGTFVLAGAYLYGAYL